MRSHLSRHYAITAALTVLLATAAAGHDVERVDRFVRSEMERQRIPGVAVAIVQRGNVLQTSGYGYANVEHRVPVRADTIFQSGSLGKMFTAAGVMLLVDDGTVRLEDPLTKYFADAPASWSAITVRHLLTHTSGLPDYTGGSVDYRRDYTEADLVKLAYTLPFEFAPGARWNYSNTGYVLLGAVIRKATGRFYGDVLRERLFVPLEMTTTRIITEEDIVYNRSAGYRLLGEALKNQEWVSPTLNTTGDGALYFSLLDLVAWDRGVRAGAILRPDSWQRMLEPVTLNSGKTYPYGFGWAFNEIGGQHVQQHGGSWQGFKTHLARYLSDDFTVIVLANLAQAEPARFVDGIAAIMNPKLVRPELTPVSNPEPAVVERARRLLQSAREGQLRREDFPYVRATFFTGTAQRYKELLDPLGDPRSIQILERRELGDDRVYQLRVEYLTKKFRVRMGLTADDKVSVLDIRPE